MRVVLDRVAARYGDRTVFSDLSGVLPDGKVSALVGPSGSGKSTLLAILGGLRAPDAGRVVLTSEMGEVEPAPAFVAWVPQGSNALGGRSALDNVMVAALAAGDEVDPATMESLRVLNRVGLKGKHFQLAKTLSGGELQRLALARALAAHRPLVLADEPTANLDEANTRLVAEVLRRISGTCTVVVATHDPILRAAADHVVSMRETDSAI